MIGMPSIMPSVARSRRICTNSFHTIECSRPRFMRARGASSPLLVRRRPRVRSRFLLLQLDEDVLEREAGAEAGAHFGRCAERLQLPAREECQTIEALGLVHVVRGDDDGGAVLLHEIADDAP